MDGNIKAPTMYTNTVNGHFWSYLKYRTIASKVGTHLIDTRMFTLHSPIMIVSLDLYFAIFALIELFVD